MFFAGQFVTLAFVFIHIVGSTFIFNIFLGQNHKLTTERTETTEKSIAWVRFSCWLTHGFFLFSVTSVASVVTSFWACCRLQRQAESLSATEGTEAK